MVRYPVVLVPDDNDTILVTFPDFPEAHTFGADASEALTHASDALATIVDAYIRAKRLLPAPSAITGVSAELSPLMSTKVDIYNAMHAQGLSKSELSRRLNWHLPQVDRLLNLNHGTGVDQLDEAARALGGSLQMKVVGFPERQRWNVPVRSRPERIAASIVTKSDRKTVARRAARKKK